MFRKLSIIFIVCIFAGCSINDKRFFSKIPHIRWSDEPTGLSSKLNIDGCFYCDAFGDPVHFDDFGFASMSQGYVVGAYELNGDTITVDWYNRDGLFYRNWTRSTCRYEIISPDTIKDIDGMYITVNTKNLRFNKYEPYYIYVRFDCPEDLKERDGFLRKQKWMWESDEARKEWKRNRKNK